MAVSAMFRDARFNKVLVVALLTSLLIVNALLLFKNLLNDDYLLSATLYGINTMAIATLLGTIALHVIFPIKDPRESLGTTFVVCVAGTLFGLSLMISLIITLGNDYTINGPISVVTCVVAVTSYVYFILIRDHS